MSNKALSLQQASRLLAYDAQTGLFTSKVARGPLKRGQSVGTVGKAGYLQIQVFGVLFYAHRLAHLLMTGEMPTGQIDHIDGDRLNNRWSNLRDASALINAQNKRRARSDSKSGLLGASKHSDGRWQARIKADGRYRHLGLFDTKEEAHQAYVLAKRQLHEGNTL